MVNEVAIKNAISQQSVRMYKVERIFRRDRVTGCRTKNSKFSTGRKKVLLQGGERAVNRVGALLSMWRIERLSCVSRIEVDLIIDYSFAG